MSALFDKFRSGGSTDRPKNTPKSPPKQRKGLFGRLREKKLSASNNGEKVPSSRFSLFRKDRTKKIHDSARETSKNQREAEEALVELEAVLPLKREDHEKLRYSMSLDTATDLTPDQIDKQKEAIEGLTDKQRKLFEKKGLVSGMYSLTKEQREQFDASGLGRSLKGQAEEKASGFFASPENRNIDYNKIPDPLKRDLLLGNLYVDDFLPDEIKIQLNEDIQKIHQLQRAHGLGLIKSPKQQKEAQKMAQDLCYKYGILPMDYEEYLKTGGQDNGLLAGLFGPIFREMTPERRREVGVGDVDAFCQRNVARPTMVSDGGGSSTPSYGPRGSYSGGGESGGGSSGGGGGGGSFSTPSTGGVPTGPAPTLDSFPDLVGSLNVDSRDWNSSQVKEIRADGGIRINMDCNQSDGRKVIPPLIVIPNDSSDLIKSAAQAYADAMAQIHNDKFGRNFTGKVVTAGQNGRGRANTIHTEGWSIEDTQMVDYLTSPEGIREYQTLLENSLGKIPGAVFGLPHGGQKGKDQGAEHGGQTEVGIAAIHLNGFAKNSGETPPTETPPTSSVPPLSTSNT